MTCRIPWPFLELWSALYLCQTSPIPGISGNLQQLIEQPMTAPTLQMGITEAQRSQIIGKACLTPGPLMKDATHVGEKPCPCGPVLRLVQQNQGPGHKSCMLCKFPVSLSPTGILAHVTLGRASNHRKADHSPNQPAFSSRPARC